MDREREREGERSRACDCGRDCVKGLVMLYVRMLELKLTEGPVGLSISMIVFKYPCSVAESRTSGTTSSWQA